MMMSRLIAACALSTGLWLGGGALAEEPAQPSDASRESMKVMNLGNPHEGQRATAADEQLDRKLEKKRSEELSEWSERHSRDIYPNMGVGGHQTDPGIAAKPEGLEKGPAK